MEQDKLQFTDIIKFKSVDFIFTSFLNAWTPGFFATNVWSQSYADLTQLKVLGCKLIRLQKRYVIKHL